MNVRDLGGIATEDGGFTRRGAVVRSDNPYRLTDAGWGALRAYGIRTLIDLRWPEERGEDAAYCGGLDAVHIPLAGDHRTPEAEHDGLPLREGETAESRIAAHYLSSIDRYQPRIAEAVAAVGNATPGGVVIHCMSGKDRTGLVCGIMLRAAGVSIRDAAADYEATSANFDRIRAHWVADAPDEASRQTRALASLVAPAAAMAGVLETIEAAHGSVTAYLIAGGAPPEAIEAVRNRLR